MANIIWGFGGVYITYQSQTVNLPLANGTVRFMPESNVKYSITGKQLVAFKGWRPEITVRLTNISETEAREIAKLMAMFNTARGNPVTVKPRYDAYAATNISYPCHCLSDVALEDIADSPVGQNLQLVFRADARFTSLPSNITDTSVSVVTETISSTEYAIVETIGGTAYAINESF